MNVRIENNPITSFHPVVQHSVGIDSGNRIITAIGVQRYGRILFSQRILRIPASDPRVVESGSEVEHIEADRFERFLAAELVAIDACQGQRGVFMPPPERIVVVPLDGLAVWSTTARTLPK